MVVFKKIKYWNFLSVGNLPIEIFLDRNRVTLILGKNGDGKSSVVEALTYVLFGKSYRGVKKGQLINSVNGRCALVELEFFVSGKTYLIRRGMKPEIFEIYENGVLLNQEAANRDYQKHLEQNILGMNYKTFKQIVILSVSNYTPFMDLSSLDRRGIIEDLLDIQIFSVMNQVLSERKSETLDLRRKVEQRIKMFDVEIRSQQEKLDSMKSKDQSLIDSNILKINEAQFIIQERIKQVDELQNILGDLSAQVGDVSSLKEKRSKLNVMFTRLSDAKKKLVKEVEFFSENDSCPVCSQEIGNGLKETMVSSKGSKIQEVDTAFSKVEQQFKEIEEKLDEADRINSEIQRINNEVFQANSSISVNQKYIRELESTISEIQSRGDDEEIEERNKLEELGSKKSMLEEKLESIMLKEEDFQVCQKLLKDGGIKTQIIDMYVPTINKILNHYLEQFGFPVSWHFDSSFNETIRSRYRDDFSYASFSNGERARLDVCIVLTFREIAKMKNSVSTNLLFLDEIGENMDSMGVERMMELLNNLPDSNVLMVTHKQEIQERVHHRVSLKKVDGFTMIDEG